MTLLELVTELRNLLEDTGGHGVDWEDATREHLLKWSNDELVTFINEAEREVAQRTKCLFDASTAEVVEIAVVAATADYYLHKSITKIRRAKLDLVTLALEQTSWRDQEALKSTWDTETGTPYYFVLDWNYGQMRLSPTPVVDDTLRLSVYRYPLEDMAWSGRNSAEPEIPVQFQRKMLYWAAHLAYEKDEPNTEDQTRSTAFEAKFAREFGPSEDMYSIERKKRTKRSISYGGIR